MNRAGEAGWVRSWSRRGDVVFCRFRDGRRRTVCAGKVRGPVVHEPPSPREQVRPGIGRFDRIADDVSQRRLDDLARVVGLFGRPVAERGPEAVGHGGDPVLLEQPAQTLVGQRLPAVGGEHERAVAERPRRIEDLDGSNTAVLSRSIGT